MRHFRSVAAHRPDPSLFAEWVAICDSAEATGSGFTAKDVKRAWDWRTGPAGNVNATVPTNFYGVPRDRKLVRLGFDFYDAVRNQHAERARNVLGTIANYARELKEATDGQS